jgi:hypothetical protein
MIFVKKKLEDAEAKFISNNVANNYRGQFIPHIPIYIVVC